MAVSALRGFKRCRPEDVGLDSAALEEHRERQSEHLKRNIYKGRAECVIVGDKLAYLDCCGKADVEMGITAITLLLLVERGLVRLDDDVGKFIPSFYDAKVLRKGSRVGATEPLRRHITIRHLLCHTAGLSYGPHREDRQSRQFAHDKAHLKDEKAYEAFVRAVDSGKIGTLAAFCDELIKIPLRFQPGEQYRYSFSMDVIARVAEVASGMQFDVLVRKSVLEPLGMRNTFFFVGKKHLSTLSGHYRGSMKRGDEKFRIKRFDGRSAEDSAWSTESRRGAKVLLSGGGIMASCTGGLVSCLQDTAAFAYMLAHGGCSIVSGKRLLQKSTYAMLLHDWLTPPAVVPRLGKPMPGWGDAATGWTPVSHVQDGGKTLFFGGWTTSWRISERPPTMTPSGELLPAKPMIVVCLNNTFWDKWYTLGKKFHWDNDKDELEQVVPKSCQQFKDAAKKAVALRKRLALRREAKRRSSGAKQAAHLRQRSRVRPGCAGHGASLKRRRSDS
eukprot:TRINITY_DN41054_c0_g1_i4.p1 TRINITY_DN41054_c0_g1~~TRINITY_DN41054_c0_g1_i4.p1  ORF type:complete len:501 (-),score=98.14 TRINITY_DN41054_c0_g1_i4:246-1748(-)